MNGLISSSTILLFSLFSLNYKILFGLHINATAYKVFRILPKTNKDISFLGMLWEKAMDLKLDFWTDQIRIDSPADIMVPPEFQSAFLNNISTSGVNCTVLIDNVEELIQQQNHTKRSKWLSRILKDEAGNSSEFRPLHTYNVFRYNSYDEMVKYMEELEETYPRIAKVLNLGHTYEGRIIKMMMISRPLELADTKRAIWIDAGIHAREWVSPVTAMYFIHLLTTNYYLDTRLASYVNNFTWYIVPNLNPDGYEYSRSSVKPEVRSWRKNRSFMEGCTPERCCAGVDLNRNFDFLWGELGSSDNRCSHVYHGTKGFSEKETQAVRDFLSLHGHQVDAFITLHSYSQFWTYPYGYRIRAYPYDVRDLRIIAYRAAKALEAKYGTVYKVGSSADLLHYAATGGSDDWVKHAIGVKFVYLIELRPDENVRVGFILDEIHLPNTARETWEGVRVVADSVRLYNEIKTKRIKNYYESAG